jgi:hypothetical protein
MPTRYTIHATAATLTTLAALRCAQPLSRHAGVGLVDLVLKLEQSRLGLRPAESAQQARTCPNTQQSRLGLRPNESGRLSARSAECPRPAKVLRRFTSPNTAILRAGTQISARLRSARRISHTSEPLAFGTRRRYETSHELPRRVRCAPRHRTGSRGGGLRTRRWQRGSNPGSPRA